MDNLLLILSLLLLGGLIAGLISLRTVIRWGNKRTRGRVFLTYGLTMVVFLILFGAAVARVKEEREEPAVLPSVINKDRRKPTIAPTRTPEQKKTVMPNYSILNEDIYDAPIKTQVTLDILISGEISELGVRALLEKLYSSIKAKKFKYRDSPTNVYIHAFISEDIYDAYNSGVAAPWIATLQKSYSDERPSIYVHMDVYQRQIAQLDAKPEKRFGVSEERRKQIWKELTLIERRAWKEAEERYPLDPTQSLRVGQAFQLSEETDLRSGTDFPGALEKIQRLPPHTTVVVLKVVTESSSVWYFVEATSPSRYSLGSGWINSLALIGQGQTDPKEQMKKQGEVSGYLLDKYEGELAKKHGLTRKELEKISIEGVEKNWPFPK